MRPGLLRAFARRSRSTIATGGGTPALAGVEAQIAALATARRDVRRALAGLRHRRTRRAHEQANALAALDRQLYLALGERRRLRAGCPILRAAEHRYEVVRRGR